MYISLGMLRLQVTFNWTWSMGFNFIDAAYDVTSGLVVFYDDGYTMQSFSTKTRKFGTSFALPFVIVMWNLFSLFTFHPSHSVEPIVTSCPLPPMAHLCLVAANTVTLSLANALDIWFDNQGTLWALYFDPQNDKQLLWANVATQTGSVSPVWTVLSLLFSCGSFLFYKFWFL